MTATAALTAQNTLGVYDIHHVPPEFLVKQIDACFDDIGVDVVKTGEFRLPDTPAPVAAQELAVLPPCACLLIHFAHLSAYTSVCVFIYIYLRVCVSARLSARLSACLASLFVCLSV